MVSPPSEWEEKQTLEQDFLWVLELSRREYRVCSSACALGCQGLFGKRPLAPTGASALRRRCSRWAGWREAGPHVRAHAYCWTRARGLRAPRRPREGGVSGVPLRWGDCGIVADGAGRRRAWSRLQNRETLPVWVRGGGESGPRIRRPPLSTAACSNCEEAVFPPGLGFAAGRYPGRPGRLPCRGPARAGRETPLTSRGPRAARTQPARTPTSATRCARALRRPESACARHRRPPPPRTGPLNRAGAASGGAGGAPR